MSVIVAKSTACCSTSSKIAAISCDCFPAVTAQRAIVAATTAIVDSAPIATYIGVKWYVTIMDSDADRTQSVEVWATHRDGTLPTHVYYGFEGDNIAYEIDVTVSGGLLNLEITNNDAETIIVTVTRLGVPVSNATPPSTNLIPITVSNTAVQSGMSGVIDYMSDTTDIQAIKWHVVITTDAGTRTMCQSFLVLSTTPVATQYALLGDMTITYTLSVVVIPGHGIEFQIANTSGQDFVVDVTRIPVNLTPSAACADRQCTTWTPRENVILPGITASIDTIAATTAEAAKWFVTATDPLTNNRMAWEHAALSTTPSSDVQYAHIADDFDLDIDTAEIAGRLTLLITNNEAFPVVINSLRVPTVA